MSSEDYRHWYIVTLETLNVVFPGRTDRVNQFIQSVMAGYRPDHAGWLDDSAAFHGLMGFQVPLRAYIEILEQSVPVEELFPSAAASAAPPGNWRRRR